MAAQVVIDRLSSAKKKLLACQTSLVAIDHVVFANYRFYHINHPFSTEKAEFFYQVC